MVTNFNEFQKKKQYLICVDSDGCAMDTMDIKHIKCFGPCMVEVWNLEQWSDEILKRWNDINLYTMTRGVNRFKGLALILREIQEQYCEIEDLETLEKWVEQSDELSNNALKQAIEKAGSISLKKALQWSNYTNESINALPEEEKKPFEGVKEALEYAHQYADIAIVSSANLQAVEDEWNLYGLSQYVDILCAQNLGSKAYCIEQLLKNGYEKNNVLMIGDAPGDLKAAKANGVLYYPILVRREKESWEEFQNIAVSNLVNGKYAGKYQDEKEQEFYKNLA